MILWYCSEAVEICKQNWILLFVLEWLSVPRWRNGSDRAHRQKPEANRKQNAFLPLQPVTLKPNCQFDLFGSCAAGEQSCAGGGVSGRVPEVWHWCLDLVLGLLLWCFPAGMNWAAVPTLFHRVFILESVCHGLNLLEGGTKLIFSSFNVWMWDIVPRNGKVDQYTAH